MNDLQHTLEEIRTARFSDLDAQLVREILAAQEAYMERPAEVLRRLEIAVEAFLQRQEVPHA